jgi:hypothetical protein
MPITRGQLATFGSVADKLTQLQPQVKGVHSSHSSLPSTGNLLNDVRIALDKRHAHQWNGTVWVNLGLGSVIWECDLRTLSNADICRMYAIS